MSGCKLQYPDFQITKKRGFPDFIVEDQDRVRIGVEVRLLRNRYQILGGPGFFVNHLVQEVAFRGYYEVNEGQLSDFIIFIVGDEEVPTAHLEEVLKKARPRVPSIITLKGAILTPEGKLGSIFDVDEDGNTW